MACAALGAGMDRPSARRARAKLQKLIDKGLVEKTSLRTPWLRAWRMSGAMMRRFQVPTVRAPRLDRIHHHLAVVDFIGDLLAAAGPGWSVARFAGDEDLRSRAFRRAFREGRGHGQALDLDAEVIVRTSRGNHIALEVEYISAAYRNADIVQKARAVPAHRVFVASDARIAVRAHRVLKHPVWRSDRVNAADAHAILSKGTSVSLP